MEDVEYFMKNSAINSLGYTGIVTLSQYSNNKKIVLKQVHNSGSNPLFNFFANCLLGDFETAKLELPTKIKLLYAEKDDNTDEITKLESASGFIYLLNKPERLYTESYIASSSICYSFIIPRDIVERSNFNSIGLYPDAAAEEDVDNHAAICMVDGVSGMSTSAVLVVDWELIITNNN